MKHYVGRITEEMRNRDEYIDLETLLLMLRSHISRSGVGCFWCFTGLSR
ncbi:MAG TPA: hypothetical protein VFD97_05645 [Acidimicrobiia bacterium]|nr:hypothetical protein [Acidimicrobiia bacterium]